MDGMQNNKRPFTQFDDNISATQADNGDNGAGDAQIQDNGTKNASFSAGGMPSVSKVDYPLPQDPHSPKGKDYADIGGAEISDQGLNERVEVGFNGGIHDYGIEGGGPESQDGMDDSISGQGFGTGKATGSTDTSE